MLREIMLDIIFRIEQDGGYSHLLIDHYVKKHNLSNKDTRLLTHVVYGTVQYQLTLDYYLEPFIKGRKVDDWVKTLLRLSVYQMKYLDRIPSHAIIYDAVEIAKKKGHRGISSFVNGVLRNIQRKGFRDVTEIPSKQRQIATQTSHPEWLLNYWERQYGPETSEKIAKTNMKQKPQSIRIQPMRTSREEMMNQLRNLNMNVEQSLFSEQGIVIKDGNILETKFVEEGYVTIQDQSSMLVSELLQVEEGMTVLDACSAPGGKATHIAEKLNNTGKVHAHDLHKNKTNIVNNNAKRLQLSNIQVDQSDARKLSTIYDVETFDRIVLDVPCTGFGVIRSKPDIKYHKNEKDISQLSNVQFEILTSVAPLLKRDGKLIYSTCTITKDENERVIEQFLQENDDFQVDQSFFTDLPKELQHTEGVSEVGIQIFPQTYNTDGFFISRLIRMRS